jgi:pimeloyl-ACP methyl ester carboxylesterase
MQSQVISQNGVDIYTESFGNEADPAVLLIMGAMASGAWWPDGLCEGLAAKGRFVIRYDHRDTGGSTSYEPGSLQYTVEDLADDAVGVLTGYGIAQADLVGMSLGGFLAQLVALKYPDRVRTLTLIASEALASEKPGMPGIDPKVLEYHASAGNLDWSDAEAVAEYQVGAWRLLAGSKTEFDPELIREMARADLQRTPNPMTPFNHAQLQNAGEWVDRLDEIQAPVLVIHGTDDIVLPFAHAERLVRLMPNSRLVPLEGTGHELPRGVWSEIIREVSQHTGE